MAIMKILFTASPLVGHVFPMLPLMHAARDGGHEVVVATGADMIPDLQRRGFTTWTVGPGLGEAIADLNQASTVPAAGHEEHDHPEGRHHRGGPGGELHQRPAEGERDRRVVCLREALRLYTSVGADGHAARVTSSFGEA